MLFDAYHTIEGDRVRITAAQASRFAKEVAGDFNPIHDADARFFCVPGDLLCALVLVHYGLSQRMNFIFRGMVGRDAELRFPAAEPAGMSITDGNGKTVLSIEREGETTRDTLTVETFIRSYAEFSGRGFPHILQPLLKQHGVMFNPTRPVVLYDSMDFTLDGYAGGDTDTELADASLTVAPKRADALLHFDIRVDGEHVGRGSKKLIVSGLRPYDEELMQQVIDDHRTRRESFRASA